MSPIIPGSLKGRSMDPGKRAVLAHRLEKSLGEKEGQRQRKQKE